MSIYTLYSNRNQHLVELKSIASDVIAAAEGGAVAGAIGVAIGGIAGAALGRTTAAAVGELAGVFTGIQVRMATEGALLLGEVVGIGSAIILGTDGAVACGAATVKHRSKVVGPIKAIARVSKEALAGAFRGGVAGVVVGGVLGALGGSVIGFGTDRVVEEVCAQGALWGGLAGKMGAVFLGSVYALADNVEGTVALGSLGVLAATLEGPEVLAVLAGGAALGVAGGMLQRYQIVQWPELKAAKEE